MRKLVSVLGIGAFAVLLTAIMTVVWVVDHQPGAAGVPQPRARGYAEAQDCRSCHSRFYELWSSSRHGRAMQEFTRELAERELPPHEGWIEIRGKKYRADIAADPPVIREKGTESDKRYPLKWVLGGKNVYYFLTPWVRGRWQMLPLAFDVREKVWYDAAGSMLRHFADNPDEPHEWTDREFSFNTSCYRCHVSQLARNYEPATDTYNTTWNEPGVNCDTCHGPGADHIKAMAAADGEVPADVEIISYRGLNATRSNATCAPCHAKMTPITNEFMPGEEYFDHYTLTTLEDRDFYPDGRDLGENYTFTLWRISPCTQSGRFACLHCHTSSGRNRHLGEEADHACLPCHEQKVREAAAHSFHPSDSTGARCVACHMAETTFARIVRHDHTMLPPTPAATIEFGSPNACNICHTDQDAKWADEWVRKWYPDDYQRPLLERARLVDAARRGDWSKLSDILAYLASDDRNEIFASSLIRLLDGYPGAEKWPAIRKALSDPSPLVRAAAAQTLVNDPDPSVTDALLPLTEDRYRLVRINAAFGLSPHPLEQLSPRSRAKVEKAFAEYEAAQHAVPDSPASYYNLGVYQQNRDRLRQAVESYQTALRLQPDFLPALLNVSVVYARLRELDQAEWALRRFLQSKPDNAEANFNLALLLAQRGQTREAEAALRETLKADPEFAAAAYNLGVLLAETGLDEAVELCRRAAELCRDEPRYAYTLAYYLRERGDREEATAVLRELLRRHPHYSDGLTLLITLDAEVGE